MSTNNVDKLKAEARQLLDKLKKITNPERNPHYKISRGGWLCFNTLFLPLAFFLPLCVLSWYNPCLTYAQPLFDVTWSLFLASFVVSFFHYCVYNDNVEFCSKLTRSNHLILGFILFSMMGASLGFLNLYAYSLELWYVMGALFSFFTYAFIYFICFFQRHHLRTCSTPNSPHTANNKKFCEDRCCEFSFETFGAVHGVLFTILSCGMIITALTLGHELWDTDVRNVEEIFDQGCMNYSVLA